MHRQPLLTALQNHTPFNAHEQTMLQNTIQFIQQNANCFERSNVEGHITGSAWIINKAHTHALLIHHNKLNKWLQPGGHADGDTDVLAVATKEALEETGLTVQPLTDTIFDVDVHRIPANKGIDAHYHYDIRYLFTATEAPTTFTPNREVKDTKWIPLEEVAHFNNEESVMRMVEKTKLL